MGETTKPPKPHLGTDPQKVVTSVTTSPQTQGCYQTKLENIVIVTCAIFQISGKCPASNKLLNNLDIENDIGVEIR